MDTREYVDIVDKAGGEGQLTAKAVGNIKLWLEDERFAKSRAELRQLIKAGDFRKINDHFREVLPFGTGGRRGPVGIGPNRINERTIGESAQGVAGYIKRVWKRTEPPLVVIGYDTRNTSRQFALLTAEIFCGNGLEVCLFDGPRATPELSFAVRYLGAEVGIVISASHNPPADNGFKVYGRDGGQIVPPVDAAIIAEVDGVGNIKVQDLEAARKEGHFREIGREIDELYWDRVAGLALVPRRPGVNVVFTPLHGTGISSVVPALEKIGLDNVHVVEAQATPDGNFPNVVNNTPNPEEPRAMEMAIAQAHDRQADLVLATDPDADRLGVAVRRSVDENEWVRLTGNQIGAVLTFHILREMEKRGKTSSESLVVKTMVTSNLIGDIAESFGVGVRTDLLVGFKYIGEVIEKNLRGAEERFIFGAEESHGYLRGTFVRDKDAAGAAVLMTELTACLKEESKTPYDLLQDLYRRYGYYEERLKSFVLKGGEGLDEIRRIMVSLRKNPPKELAGTPVVSVEDYERGKLVDPATGKVLSEIPRPKGNVLIFRLSGDGRSWLAARPSGTEPKIKFYLSIHSPVGLDADLVKVKHSAAAHADRILALLPLA